VTSYLPYSYAPTASSSSGTALVYTTSSSAAQQQTVASAAGASAGTQHQYYQQRPPMQPQQQQQQQAHGGYVAPVTRATTTAATTATQLSPRSLQRVARPPDVAVVQQAALHAQAPQPLPAQCSAAGVPNIRTSAGPSGVSSPYVPAPGASASQRYTSAPSHFLETQPAATHFRQQSAVPVEVNVVSSSVPAMSSVTPAQVYASAQQGQGAASGAVAAFSSVVSSHAVQSQAYSPYSYDGAPVVASAFPSAASSAIPGQAYRAGGSALLAQGYASNSQEAATPTVSVFSAAASSSAPAQVYTTSQHGPEVTTTAMPFFPSAGGSGSAVPANLYAPSQQNPDVKPGIVSAYLSGTSSYTPTGPTLAAGSISSSFVHAASSSQQPLTGSGVSSWGAAQAKVCELHEVSQPHVATSVMSAHGVQLPPADIGVSAQRTSAQGSTVPIVRQASASQGNRAHSAHISTIPENVSATSAQAPQPEVRSTYLCPTCNQTYSTLEDVRQHWIDDHAQPSEIAASVSELGGSSCPPPSETAASTEAKRIVKHLCPECLLACDSQEEARQHWLEHHYVPSDGVATDAATAAAAAADGTRCATSAAEASEPEGTTTKAQLIETDAEGRPVIVRHTDTETGVSRTVVIDDDGSQRVFGEETVESMLSKAKNELDEWIEDMTERHLRGLVNEVSQRLCEKSGKLHDMRQEMEKLSRRNNFAYFGLAEGAAPKELDNAYRRLARAMHPDKNGGTAEASRVFQSMKEKYEELKYQLAHGLAEPAAPDSAPAKSGEEGEADGDEGPGARKDEEKDRGAKSDDGAADGDGAAEEEAAGDAEKDSASEGAADAAAADGGEEQGGAADAREKPRSGKGAGGDREEKPALKEKAWKLVGSLKMIDQNLRIVEADFERIRAEAPGPPLPPGRPGA